jgi:SAM-dependent methyltransferase
MLKDYKTTLKRVLKGNMIRVGLINPGVKNRHGWVGDVTLSGTKRDFQIAFLKNQGLQPEHRLLDLGCGTLRGGIPIIEYLNVEKYTGIDVRAEVLQEAMKELAETGLAYKTPLLMHSNEVAVKLDGIKFDYIWAFSVLFHLSDSILRETISLVAEHLNPVGTFYGNVNIGQWREGDWQGFPVVTRPLNFYEREAAKCHLRLKVIGSLESLGHLTGRSDQDEQIMLELRHKQNDF